MAHYRFRLASCLLPLVAALWLAPAPAHAATGFQASVAQISPGFGAKMTSWRAGCPVPLADLRIVHATFWTFGGTERQGKLIVHRDSARRMVRTMRRLYDARFRIRSMYLPERYAADDQRMMRANNSSAFNCRYVAGTKRWSQHAYGRAVDINPVQNPWVSGDHVSPAQGRQFLNRSRARRGLIRRADAVVRSFSAVTWKWGGYWTGARDYMHFSANGR